jgi:hypothetical protein
VRKGERKIRKGKREKKRRKRKVARGMRNGREEEMKQKWERRERGVRMQCKRNGEMVVWRRRNSDEEEEKKVN